MPPKEKKTVSFKLSHNQVEKFVGEDNLMKIKQPENSDLSPIRVGQFMQAEVIKEKNHESSPTTRSEDAASPGIIFRKQKEKDRIISKQFGLTVMPTYKTPNHNKNKLNLLTESTNYSNNVVSKQFNCKVRKISKFKRDINNLIEDNNQSMSFFNQIKNSQKVQSINQKELSKNKNNIDEGKQI